MRYIFICMHTHVKQGERCKDRTKQEEYWWILSDLTVISGGSNSGILVLNRKRVGSYMSKQLYESTSFQQVLYCIHWSCSWIVSVEFMQIIIMFQAYLSLYMEGFLDKLRKFIIEMLLLNIFLKFTRNHWIAKEMSLLFLFFFSFQGFSHPLLDISLTTKGCNISWSWSSIRTPVFA